MKSANAIKTYRKSGVAEGSDLRCAIRVPRFYRSTTTFPFVIPSVEASAVFCLRQTSARNS